MTDTTIDIDQRALIERGAAAERTRIADIQKRCKLGKMDAAFTQQLIDDGVSGDAIGARILDVIVDRQEAIPTRSQSSISSHGFDDDHRSSDGRDDLSEGIIGTLMRRLGVRAAKPHPATRDFQDMPLPQMMRMHLAASRGSRMSSLLQQSNHEIVSQAMSTRGGLHTTSDFPGLLGSAVNRALRQLQEAEVPSFRAWTKAGLGRDFKTMERLALGSAPALEKVNEGGEYEFGSFAEDKATFALAKYGKIFAISYEALTNDDLGAFDGVPSAMIRTANRLGSKLVYDSFALNSGAGPTMPDGLALFHATHANLQGTAVAFDSAALSTARVLLRKQQANKEGYLGLEPKFLIVGPERETVAETLLSAGALIKTATGEAPNPSWISRLTLVVDPRINANSMYLLASPAQIDTYEFAELEGENGPVVETKTDFEVDQFALKVRYVCGGAWVDFRGAVKVSLI